MLVNVFLAMLVDKQWKQCYEQAVWDKIESGPSKQLKECETLVGTNFREAGQLNCFLKINSTQRFSPFCTALLIAKITFLSKLSTLSQ